MGGSRRSRPSGPATVPPDSRHPRLPPKRGRRHGGDGRRARSLRPAAGSDHRRAGDRRRDVNSLGKKSPPPKSLPPKSPPKSPPESPSPEEELSAKTSGGGERLAEQEPGEQARTEAEAAPVCRREAGVDVTDRCAVDLHIAHLGLDALVDLVRADGARRNGTAGSTIGRRPVDIAHRHAVPRVKKA